MILKFGRNKCKGNQNKNITLQSEYFYYPSRLFESVGSSATHNLSTVDIYSGLVYCTNFDF